MHIIQEKILNLIKKQTNFGKLSLREIARRIEVPGKPQIVKHHLQQLSLNGFIELNLKDGSINLTNAGKSTSNLGRSIFYSVPILGSANCGPALDIAEDDIKGYVKISSKLLPRNKKNIFALVADGKSMNRAEVNGNNIEDGDLVIVDGNSNNYKTGDIVVAVLDGLANIKKIRLDKRHERIILESDSTDKYLPIYIHEDDNFILNGKVIDVIKS